MGIFEWLLGGGDEDRVDPQADERSQPRPATSGTGPDIDAGRAKTQTEQDLRRVEGQYDPDSDSFTKKK